MEFRFVYFTPRYDETVAFFRDALEFPVHDSWDRPGDSSIRCTNRVRSRRWRVFTSRGTETGGQTEITMNRLMIPAATAAAALLAVPAIAVAQANKQGATVFQVTLEGENEVPTVGDLDGTGRATIRVNPRKGEICYQLRVSGIEPATAAHIHEAPARRAGPVVVGLTAPTSGSSKGCVAISQAKAQEIVDDPADYYVNVHNAPFPGGALRGQLGK